MKSKLMIIIGMLLTAMAIGLATREVIINEPLKLERKPIWQIRSIDTMKYSRDVAKAKLNDKSYDKIIEKQIRNIAKTGATHVAVATPYDQEFIPFLTRWVSEARKNKLKVWFRGNFSGWEGWFGYSKIGREKQLKLLEEFLNTNSGLFEDGDIFTPCPECENGGPGDPRHTGDILGHRQFLIDQYQLSKTFFENSGKKVKVGYFSMNYDVARLVMDPQTTMDVGGIVVIDHYVAKPQQLSADAREISEKSGGKVVFGEFGVPIPDIHGKMTEEEQAAWIEKALEELAKNKQVIGINYWTSVGGSTGLWNGDGRAKPAVEIIRHFFSLAI